VSTRTFIGEKMGCLACLSRQSHAKQVAGLEIKLFLYIMRGRKKLHEISHSRLLVRFFQRDAADSSTMEGETLPEQKGAMGKAWSTVTT
jgi:hypothetical protein